jgi:folate-binding protein YgfZ
VEHVFVARCERPVPRSRVLLLLAIINSWPMTQIELNPGAAARIAVGHYNGVDAPLSYGDTPAELTELRTGCGVFQLGWRGLVTVSGKDRTRWLHNMTTNNIRDLAANRGVYAFVLNHQGRILGDMTIYNLGESLLMETDRSQIEPLLTAMKRYIIMDKVELNDDREQFFALGLCGPDSAEVLTQAGFDVKEMEPLEVREQTVGGAQCRVIRGNEQKPGWYEIWCGGQDWKTVADLVRQAGAKQIGTEALEQWRVLHGIPQYGQDIRDRDLPQETGQMQALSFTKGCYIGQEIVERIRSRGQVHRKFTGFDFGSALLAPGKFESDGRTLAEVTTSLAVRANGATKNIGLGYVRHEAVTPEGTVELGGQHVKIVDLPFESI